MQENKLENVLKSPLASILLRNSEELCDFAVEIDNFFAKELCLLKGQIQEVFEDVQYYQDVLKNFKEDPSERKRHVLNAARRMLLFKFRHFMNREQMIIFSLKEEEKKLTRQTQQLLRKYNLLQ